MKKQTALDLLQNCQSYLFVGDIRTGYYHSHKCPLLSKIPIKFAQGCGKKPRKSGFLPCPVCQSRAVENMSEKEYFVPMRFIEQTNFLANVKRRSKSQIMKEQLLLLSKDLGMHLNFIGGLVYITTIAGEWFFDYNDRPINLHHMNNYTTSDKCKIPQYTYYPQDIEVSTPAHALAYIYRHEVATIRRLTSVGTADN